MIAVYSPHHILHNPPKEIISNQVTAYGESPVRVELIYEALMDVPGVKLTRATEHDMEHFLKIHSADYLGYLQTAYAGWTAAGLWQEGILPEFFALGRMRDLPVPESPEGKAGFYMTDSCTMIVKDTWEAVRYSGFTALTAAGYLLRGEPAVFALCRPPGHHAGYDYAGGYCFVNNSALAAKYLQDEGSVHSAMKNKVAILDLDFHHGNGTQDVVQRLNDILLISIHGDPAYSYPYITGYARENTHRNINHPLPPGTGDEAYFGTLCQAVRQIREFGARYLVVSLGVDTFEKEALGNFDLTAAIYPRMARYLQDELKIPLLVVMEGGYNMEFLAGNVMAFLKPLIGQRD